MKQQVNLYQKQFHLKREWFRAKMVLELCALWAALLIITALYQQWQTHLLEKKVVSMRAQQIMEAQRLQHLTGKKPIVDEASALTREILLLTEEITEKQQLADLLSAQKKQYGRGFSSYFEGLARNNLPNVWLQTIRFSEGGDQIVIEGNALHPENIPVFVRSLATEEIFTGQQFKILTLRETSEKNPIMRFSLTTILPEQ